MRCGEHGDRGIAWIQPGDGSTGARIELLKREPQAELQALLDALEPVAMETPDVAAATEANDLPYSLDLSNKQ